MLAEDTMNQDAHGPDQVSLWRRIICLGLTATLLTLGFLNHTPRPGIHYIQYRAAGSLLLMGRNPYDKEEQSRLQGPVLRPEVRLLPYFYPPWLALACAPLSLFPYPAANVIFLFLICLCLVLAGALLHSVASGLSLWATVMLVVGFFPSLFAAQTSQTSPLVLLLAVTAWRWLELGKYRLAGVALAGLTIKPQLSLGIATGVLLWAARSGRWRLIGAFAATVGLLCLASTILMPQWPIQMVEATRRIPLPIESHPEIGVTWPSLLRALGLRGWPLLAAYSALAIPTLAVVVRWAWDRRHPVGDVIGVGSIAAFVIAPYAQFYDFPILSVSLFGLIGNQQPSGAMFGLMLAFIVVPYLNFLAMGIAGWPPCSFVWVPATLATAWSTRRETRTDRWHDARKRIEVDRKQRTLSNKRHWSTTDYVLCLLLPAIVLTTLLATRPFTDVARNDDVAYAHSVRILAETWTLTYTGWNTTMMVPQILWGALVTRACGFSHNLLALTGIIAAVLVAPVTYRLARLSGCWPAPAAMATACLALNPIFLSVAPSFMSDVPSILLLLLALHVLVSSLNQGGDEKLHLRPGRLVVSTILAYLAGANRQVNWVAYLGSLATLALFIPHQRRLILSVLALLLGAAVPSVTWFQAGPTPSRWT